MLMKCRTTLAKREEGISALEYILIALVIALVIIVGASYLGNEMNAKYSQAASTLSVNPILNRQ